MDDMERIKKEKMEEWMKGKNGEQTVINVSDETFEERVLKRSKKVSVIVDFWAPWCIPCTVLGPALEKVVEESDGKVVLAKVNVDEHKLMAQKYGVMGIPAVKLFKNGEIVDEFVGLRPEQAIREWLDRNIQ